MKKKIKRILKKKLSNQKFWDLVLSSYYRYDYWLKDSPFRDADERKKAWFEHRDEILGYMKGNGKAGFMPGAWWDYEASDRPKCIGETPFGNGKTQICYNTGRTLSGRKVWEDEKDVLKRLQKFS